MAKKSKRDEFEKSMVAHAKSFRAFRKINRFERQSLPLYPTLREALESAQQAFDKDDTSNMSWNQIHQGFLIYAITEHCTIEFTTPVLGLQRGDDLEEKIREFQNLYEIEV